MACGTPSLSTNCGDASSIVLNSRYLVPVQDPFALSAAIYNFSQLPRSQRKLDGLLSREKILSSFSLHHMLSEYIAQYSSVLSGL